MRIIEVDIQIRVSVKELDYFAYLTQCSIRQQSVFGWLTVMPVAPVTLIFQYFGHVSQDAALYQPQCRSAASCESYARRQVYAVRMACPPPGGHPPP